MLARRPSLMRLAFLLLFAAAACAPSVVVGSSWNADTGIYGSYDHFGDPPNGRPTFLCGVGYDVRYRGTLPLEALDVAVRYPPDFLARTGAQPLGQGTDGWVRPLMSSGISTTHPTPPDPAALGHASGTVGTICSGGASDLDSLRGTTVRVRWREHGAEHQQDFTVDRIRGNVRVFAGDLSSDGLPRLEWER